MKKAKSTGIGDTPLKFAAQLSEVVNSEWKRSFERFPPITQDLLKFWFSDTFCDNRKINFHAGQKQAILNTIYCHEILGVQSVLDMYRKSVESLLDETLIKNIDAAGAEKHAHPKYCIKMATGTGKTWCMNALFLWQYLNAKYGQGRSYTKNFLFVAPGLIVYERLLNSFLGKENPDGTRDFESSDLKKNQELFIPYKYREAVYNFVQNSTIGKEDIGRAMTGEGIIAITNWHALNNDEDKGQNCAELHSPKALLKDVLPIQPGKTSGHALDSLDSRYFGGEILGYLKGLPDICVFNDEAHHIHDNNVGGEASEVEWQKALNSISAGKDSNFMQIDFSATPYKVSGTGRNLAKHYFPHIIADFSLNEAIRAGLVKMIAIDRRKEFLSLEDGELDFSAVRDANNAISLSKGQRFMLRAGLQKLRLLEEEFTSLDAKKHPKMLVICEDTNVSPLVSV